MKKLLLIIFSFVFLLFPKTVSAVSVEVSNVPSEVDFNQEFNVTVSMNCSGCGDSYLRGVFYKSGNKYFGFTKNNSGQWYELSGDKKLYFLVEKGELVSGTWSGKLKVKPKTDSSNYEGDGNYTFKVIRYTPSNAVSAYSNEFVLKITGYNPTPSPTESPTEAPTSTPAPTASPTPTSTKTSKPIVKSKKTSKPTSVLGDDDEDGEDSIDLMRDKLNGEENEGEDEDSDNEEKKKKISIVSILLILCGVGLVGVAGYSFYIQKQEGFQKRMKIRKIEDV